MTHETTHTEFRSDWPNWSDCSFGSDWSFGSADRWVDHSDRNEVDRVEGDVMERRLAQRMVGRGDVVGICRRNNTNF